MYSVNFNKDNMIINTVLGGDEVTYSNIKFSDLCNEGDIGCPELPVEYITFSVPAGVDKFEVLVDDLQTEELFLSNKLYPGQYPIPTLIGYKPKGFVEPDESVYNSEMQYPEQRVKIVHDGFLDGDKRLLTIAIYPVTYFPLLGKLELSKQLSLRIRPSASNSLAEKKMIPRLSRNMRAINEEVMKFLKSVVVNPEEIKKNISNLPLKTKTSTKPTSLPYYEYCVITTRELSHSFERLIAWKREKGLNAGVICVEDLLSNNEISGDLISNLYDNAAKIRGYLQLAFQYGGAKYVLFGGNDRVLPIRYGTGGENRWASGADTIALKIPTDLYFSDLNGNWNKDGDKYLGEYVGDLVNYYPELYVGRILCTSSEEVERYTTKLLKYEQKPGKGDFSYLKKAFYCQSDQMQRDQQANKIALDMQEIFSQYNIIEESPTYSDSSPTYPTGNIVIDSMNQNRSGFLSWFGHGSPEGISVRTNGVSQGGYYGITALQEDVWYLEKETANGLNNLTNMDYPAIAYSIACTVTPFDIVNEYNVKHNVGESFTVGGLYGGPAFIGNTRYGWVSSSYLLQKEFNKHIKNGNTKLGAAEAYSKSSYKSGSNKHWMALANNLIGCPEFDMWTDIPAYFNPLVATYSSSSVQVNVSDVDSAIVSVRGLFGSDYVAKKMVTMQSPSVNFIDIPENVIVTVNKHNYIPKILPLYAQNKNITGFSYIHASDAFLGKNVISTKNQGELIVKSGAEVIIEKSGVVSLESGFEVEKGGVFEVK